MEQQEPTFEYKLIPSDLNLIQKPKIKGWYVLGSTNKLNTVEISLPFKPKWLHRQMMRIFFGWYWVDEK